MSLKVIYPAEGTICVGDLSKKVMTVRSLICDNIGTCRGVKAELSSQDKTISTSIRITQKQMKGKQIEKLIEDY